MLRVIATFVIAAALATSANTKPITEASAEKLTLKLICYGRSRGEHHNSYLQLYTDAFSALGYQVKLLYRTRSANNSEQLTVRTDGDCVRTPAIEQESEYQGLLRVPTPLLRYTMSAWRTTPSPTPVTLDMLVSQQWIIGHNRGNKMVEQFIQKYQFKSRAYDNIFQGIKFLNTGDSDVFITADIAIDWALKQEPSLVAPIKAGTLLDTYMYMYLHKRHSALIKPLANEFSRLLSNPEHPVHQHSGLTAEDIKKPD